ncbi:unnamed protein product [Ambrosiozyma monospora]|uniref:Unnamed protein product n=1 Tax=Ambrosiozyma monospora TaxID=43982 RepID=A0ACB5T1T3_AMBMO|nr:unnamed protein product [Ambrosiozyma monospora]
MTITKNSNDPTFFSEKKQEKVQLKENLSVTESINEKSQYKSTWRGKLWESFDYPPEERWFIFKLDATLLFLGSAGVFLRYLDQQNLTNAFVSGMKEDLKMFGNELNYCTSVWTVGYCIGQIPCTLLMTKFKPHYVLAFIEIIWSIITFATSSITDLKSLYAARFFLGLFEAGHFPVVICKLLHIITWMVFLEEPVGDGFSSSMELYPCLWQ